MKSFTSKIVQLDDGDISYLIGRKGQRINDLSQKHQVTTDCMKKHPGQIKVRGDQSAVDSFVKEAENIIAKRKDTAVVKPVQTFSTVAQFDAKTREYLIKNNRENLKHLCEKHNVEVTINRKSSAVWIQGLQKSVDAFLKECGDISRQN